MAVVGTNGLVEFSNSALEDALGISRRTIVGSALADTFTEPSLLLTALHGVRELWSADHDFSRFSGLRIRNPLV